VLSVLLGPSYIAPSIRKLVKNKHPACIRSFAAEKEFSETQLI
jgi:hypothetical protein